MKCKFYRVADADLPPDCDNTNFNISYCPYDGNNQACPHFEPSPAPIRRLWRRITYHINKATGGNVVYFPSETSGGDMAHIPMKWNIPAKWQFSVKEEPLADTSLLRERVKHLEQRVSEQDEIIKQQRYIILLYKQQLKGE